MRIKVFNKLQNINVQDVLFYIYCANSENEAVDYLYMHLRSWKTNHLCNKEYFVHGNLENII